MPLTDETLEELKITTRNTVGLRNMLFEELDNLRNGKITPKHAHMISKLAGDILSTVRLEIDLYRHPVTMEFAALPTHPSLDVAASK